MGGKLTGRDRLGARVQERPGLVEVVADHEPAPLDLTEDESAELTQVHDVVSQLCSIKSTSAGGECK